MPAAITFFHGNFFGQCLPMVAVYLLWSVFTYGGSCNLAKRKRFMTQEIQWWVVKRHFKVFHASSQAH